MSLQTTIIVYYKFKIVRMVVFLLEEIWKIQIVI